MPGSVRHDGAIGTFRVRLTIKDVAREAGVSIKTVSRVLNKERYVGEATRARVEAAVEALKFRPSLAARTLGGRRSFQIGLVCDNPSPYYVYEMQSGVRDRCELDGVRMIAQPYHRQSDRLLDEIEGLIATTAIDGLILTPPITDRADVLALLAQHAVRFVRVAPGAQLAESSSVFIDNRAAARAMTEHLLGLGHRRIGLVAGHADFATSVQRTEGHRDALQAAGIAPDPTLEAQGDYDFASGARAGAALLTRADPPTAIFACSDDMAAGVLAAAHGLGLKLPDACSIAGFGDDALAGYVWPPLTTIRQPTRALGWHAADLLLATDAAVEYRERPFELVVRASTAPLNR